MVATSWNAMAKPGYGASKKFNKARRMSSSNRSDEGSSGELPHVQVFLDNRLPWYYFKQDILKLIHQLRIPRWRRWIDMDMAQDLQVKRISGALTNAIYCIQPPEYTKETVKAAFQSDPALSANRKSYHQLMPARLLLRVYGPQVDFLIDRDTELAVLRRLEMKDIGPRLLGTFTNGRFEQFLDALPLTKEDLRDPDVSVQIAKRMRELHDNIQLLPSERVQGPTIWANYDKWMTRAVQVLEQLERKTPGSIKQIMQTDLRTFMSTVKKYRAWVIRECGGEEAVKKELVFAHNDTQYGNILRFQPPSGSPLLSARYEHRQLMVIDFEYSAANVRGFDISNHFCEWMNDYHHAETPHHIWEDRYPTREQQLNHIQGYVEHGIDSFEDEEKIEKEVEHLMKQVLDWRPAVHVYWCIWGIVQAVVDESSDLKQREQHDEESGYKFTHNEEESNKANSGSPELDGDIDDDDSDSFDYISYASEKAQLFWSDMIDFGFVTKEDYEGNTKFLPTE